MATPCDDELNWAELGKRVSDPKTASLIVNFLNQHPPLRAKHGGLYLLASESLLSGKDKRQAEGTPNRAWRYLDAMFGFTFFGYRCLRLAVRILIALTAIAFGYNRPGRSKRRPKHFTTVSYPH